MTNQKRYEILKQKANNKPEDMGILQFSELILRKLPEAKYLAKFRPEDDYTDGMADAYDLEPDFEDEDQAKYDDR